MTGVCHTDAGLKPKKKWKKKYRGKTKGCHGPCDPMAGKSNKCGTKNYTHDEFTRGSAGLEKTFTDLLRKTALFFGGVFLPRYYYIL